MFICPTTKLVMDSIKNELSNHPGFSIFLCGDWNNVDDISLDSRNRLNNGIALMNEMKQIISNHNLIDDPFRYINPQKIEFTHCGNHRSNPEARLDRIYASSSCVPHLTLSKILPSFSDHKVAFSLFNFNSPTYFKRFTIHNSILDNDAFESESITLLDEFLMKEKWPKIC